MVELRGIFYSKYKKKVRETTSRISVEPEDIKYVGELVSDDGKTVRNRCKISVKDLGEFIVIGSYKKIKAIKEGKTNKMGFIK